MPIIKKSRRKMSPLARKVAVLHNDAAALARRLRALAADVQAIEEAIYKTGAKPEWFEEEPEQ